MSTLPEGVEVYLAFQQAAPTRWLPESDPLPDLSRCGPVRAPRSNAHGRHVPAAAYSTTNRCHVDVESGLEHDLVRRLDRDPQVALLLGQPLLLTFGDGRSHVPDLLSQTKDGSVCVWDVRNPRRLDQRFVEQTARTREFTRRVGWSYDIFTGPGDVERLNLLWLNGYRHPPEWLFRHLDHLNSVTEAGTCSLQDLMDQDEGSGEFISCVWHLIWADVLRVDLDSRITATTTVTRPR